MSQNRVARYSRSEHVTVVWLEKGPHVLRKKTTFDLPEKSSAIYLKKIGHCKLFSMRALWAGLVKGRRHKYKSCMQ